MKILKKDFKAWLKSKDDGDRVGTSSTTTSCPIAHYARETFDLKRSQVDISMFFIELGGDTRETPQWAAKFIASVDQDNGNGGTITNKKITKEQALGYLG